MQCCELERVFWPADRLCELSHYKPDKQPGQEVFSSAELPVQIQILTDSFTDGKNHYLLYLDIGSFISTYD